MGNCVNGQQHTIRVMDADGKILEYQTPIKVHQVLSEFSGYVGISDTLPVMRYLTPHSYMSGHCMYYLVPRPVRPLEEIVNGGTMKKKKKKVRFAEEGGEGESSGAVRIKLVITRAELNELMRNGMVANRLSDSQADDVQETDCSADHDCHYLESGQWTPALQTIHEADNHGIV